MDSKTEHDQRFEFETVVMKVGKSSMYARLDPNIIKFLKLHPRQKGTAIIKDSKIILNFTK